MAKTAGKLTELQRRFVEHYMGDCAGNGAEAARRAGLTGTDDAIRQSAVRMLKMPAVKQAIADRIASDPVVKTREQLQKFWSQVMDGAEHISNRLKASELLARTHGMFVDRHEHTGAGGQPLATATVHYHFPGKGRLKSNRDG